MGCRPLPRWVALLFYFNFCWSNIQGTIWFSNFKNTLWDTYSIWESSYWCYFIQNIICNLSKIRMNVCYVVLSIRNWSKCDTWATFQFVAYKIQISKTFFQYEMSKDHVILKKKLSTKAWMEKSHALLTYLRDVIVSYNY